MTNERKNIVCIGTSNSIIGIKGFLKSLSIKHTVTNLSIGRCPFYMHISTILKNKTLIEENDLLIIDHLSNHGFINSYKYNDYLVEFYNLLASLNIIVIIIAFPSLIKKDDYVKHRTKAKELASDRNLTFIDFKPEHIPKEFLSDFLHINIFSSYIFGEFLSDICDSLDSFPKPINGSFSGFEIIEPKNYNNKFKTSLVQADYYDLENKEINFKVKGHLLSIGYISNGISKFTLNDKCYHIDSKHRGLFYDSFNKDLYFDGILKIKDSNSQDSQVLVDRKSIISEEETKPLFLMCLLFAKEFKNTPSINRSLIPFNIDVLKERLFFSQSTSLIKNEREIAINNLENIIKPNFQSPDILRIVALAFEKSGDITTAKAIMEKAHELRPNGPFIKKKLEEYKKILGEKK